MNTEANTAPSIEDQDFESSGPAKDVKRLRVWPAVIVLALLWLSQFAMKLLPDSGPTGFMLLFFGPLVAAAGVLAWWLFLSRATRSERLGGALGMLVIATVCFLLADPSIQNVFVATIYGLTWGVTAFAGALILLGAWKSSWRTVVALLAALAGFGVWDAMRYDGMTGDFKSSLKPRWSTTPEDRYLATLTGSETPSPGATPTTDSDEALTNPEWPGFRGPQRDSVVPNVAVIPDWSTHPPKQRWRRFVGPGWSSFCVAGDRLYTQEQRGEKEAVVCLDTETGQTHWAFEYDSRFFEAVGGPGPRATPTFANERLYVLGALGILHCLDPRTGQVFWKRDLRNDAQRDPPLWGFASSPLVVGDYVIVYAGGKDDHGVIAYDVRTGERLWSVAAGDHSYGSPQLVVFQGKPLVLMHTNTGLHLIDPEQGRSIGEHVAPIEGYTVLQPLLVNGDSLMLGLGILDGTRRVDLTMSDNRVQLTERWTSRDLKPGFNDWVAHRGALYGFDQEIFACINLETGKRHWKKGRYGTGQVLLLPENDQLLVLSEKGELVLLRATTEMLDELARCQVLEGKTWNHPVLVGDRLYVRNAEEAACWEIPLDSEGSSESSNAP
jgi:outer membrane protein assembly factor BamB